MDNLIWVIYMETRLEKNKRLRKNKWIKICKSFFILAIIVLLIFGIQRVNDTIIELNCIKDANIIKFNCETNKLDIFGKSYIIDFKEIKKFFKDQLSGLFSFT